MDAPSSQSGVRWWCINDDICVLVMSLARPKELTDRGLAPDPRIVDAPLNMLVLVGCVGAALPLMSTLAH